MARKDLPTYSLDTLKQDATKRKDVLVDRFGHYLDEHPDLHFPHRHSFYHLVYFSKGSGTHSIDFIEFPVVAGQIYFMVPGQVHGWYFDRKPEGFIINFSVDFLNILLADARYLEQFRFFSGVASEQVIDIPASNRKEIERLFETMVTENKTNRAHKADAIRVMLVQLFIHVARTIPEETQAVNYNSVLFRNFQKLIEQHYREKRLTKEYAALLYVTPNHLNALSKDLTGQSAGELIRDRVLLEAKRLLVNARLNVSEIADELSFEDHSYFSKFFKKYTGVTPETFRKQIIQK